MKRFVLDTHTHTIVSGHAFSSLLEVITEAQKKGLELLAVTDHGPHMPGSVEEGYFYNYKVVPRKHGSLELLMGIESDIIDHNGTLCISERTQQRLEYIIASMHPLVHPPGTKKENTAAYIGAMRNPWVCTLGHIDDARYPVDYEAIVKEAKETGTLIEANNASLHPQAFRQNARENMTEILHLCEKYQAPVIVSSDAHIWCDVGNFRYVEELLCEISFPEELIVNTSVQKFKDFIAKKRSIMLQ